MELEELKSRMWPSYGIGVVFDVFTIMKNQNIFKINVGGRPGNDLNIHKPTCMPDSLVLQKGVFLYVLFLEAVTV